MKLAVIGSRTFDDYLLLKSHLDNIPELCEIISGGAKGADTLAGRYAKEHELLLTTFVPDWKKYGRGAGIVRNRHIIEAADRVIAFWDGKSRGTESSIQIARKLNKPIEIVIY